MEDERKEHKRLWLLYPYSSPYAITPHNPILLCVWMSTKLDRGLNIDLDIKNNVSCTVAVPEVFPSVGQSAITITDVGVAVSRYLKYLHDCCHHILIATVVVCIY